MQKYPYLGTIIISKGKHEVYKLMARITLNNLRRVFKNKKIYVGLLQRILVYTHDNTKISIETWIL